MRRLLIVSATAICALLLSGCQGQPDAPDPEPTPEGVASDLVPGACIAAQGEASVLGDTAVTEDAIVDCDAPHLYEVLAAQDIPGQYLTGTEATEDDLTRLQGALDGARSDSVQIRFASFADTYCDIALQRQVGFDADAELAGTDIATLRVVPLSHSVTPYAVLPAEGWTEQPTLLCLSRFVQDAETPSEAPAVNVTGAQMPVMLTADLPVDQRLCLSFDASGVPSDTSCEAVHDAEYTIEFDATTLLDADQLEAASGDNAAPLPEDVQEILDAACEDGLDLVLGPDHDEAIAGHALRGVEGWGADGLENSVSCYASAVDEAMALPAGSIFGAGDAPIELVPRD